ncbi:phosphatase PAP2 family protein [Helcococcus bovis]|uniref:phosphatase PAP2 family protein n=2 Tax=Helcococcus bovis TaxID=3153252 RepID=UPI0038BC426B
MKQKKSTILNIKNKLLEKKYAFSWLFIYVVFCAATYELFNRPFGTVRNLKIPFDDMIPLIKELIIPYHTYIPTLIVVGYIIYKIDFNEYKKMILALFLAQITAYIVFMLFQTYVPRYDINLLGNDIFSNIIKHTYLIDGTYSGAPSMHVCVMSLGIFYLFKIKFNNIAKALLISYMLLICATTVLVKQHVFLDIPFGLLHAILNYCIIEFTFLIKSKN